ncbi:MAG: GNAT family N-acetyltransferase [Planctomycetota bacterium]|jgi:ribosomal protein S18 acetylase RimI-like enzyme
MRTIPLTIKHARDVAALHITGIDKGFISSLGIEFVTALYEAIARSKSSFGYAIEDNDRVLGFVTFTGNLNKLYKSVIAKNGLRFALLLVSKMFSLKLLKRVFETLTYPLRVKKTAAKKDEQIDLPSAELLSIVINPEDCQMGLATKLVRKSFEHCKEMGLENVKVLVGADNEAAKKLYEKCGFELICQIDNHGQPSNVYEAKTEEAIQKSYEAEMTTMHYFASHRDVIKSVVEQEPKAVACVA